MISQDRIDHYCVMAFKTILKLLEERIAMTPLGMLEPEYRRLQVMQTRLERIVRELGIRPYVHNSHNCPLVKLDQWYIEGYETLRSFVAERAKDGKISKEQYNRLWEIHKGWDETLRSLQP